MKAGDAIKQKVTVLCVDDELQILSSLKRCLRDDSIHVVAVDCGHKALEILKQQTVDIIITDMRMPNMSGVELLQRVYESWPQIRRYLLTGYADMSSLADAVNFGKIDHFIEKPWDNRALMEQIEESVADIRKEQAKSLYSEQVAEQNKKLWVVKSKLEEKNEVYADKIREVMQGRNNIHESMHKLLQDMVEVHPHLSGSFSADVGKTARNFAKFCQLSIEDINEIEMSGQLCELGLLGTDNHLMTKPFNKLSYRLQREYFDQVENVETLLAPIPSLKGVANILMNQFEHVDGTGHPAKKQLQDIPIGSRILAIVRDFWRYKLGRLKNKMMMDRECFIEMRKFKGIRYDAVLLDAFIKNPSIISSTQKTSYTLVEDVTPGCIVSNDVYDEQKRLLLPKDHVLTEKCIEMLKRVEKTQDVQLRIEINSELA